MESIEGNYLKIQIVDGHPKIEGNAYSEDEVLVLICLLIERVGKRITGDDKESKKVFSDCVMESLGVVINESFKIAKK
jgi:hypothetical protein